MEVDHKKKRLEINQSATKKHGLLLINLGSPSAPTTDALHDYLKEFLSDPNVIQISRLQWLPILYGIILPFRAPKSAALYKKVWTPKGAPLLINSIELSEKIQKNLSDKEKAEIAMRYGLPSIEVGLKSLTDAGCDQVTAIAMFPQFSFTTAGSIKIKLKQVLKKYTCPPKVKFISDFSSNSTYIECLSNMIRSANGIADDEILVISFHGIPKRYVSNGDPYPQYCEATAKALTSALNLKTTQFVISYQSRLGKEEWLRPYTDETIIDLAKSGKKVVVICPGFVADCLETLDEINREMRHLFYENGGKSFRYIACLNASDDFALTISNWFHQNPPDIQSEDLT